jgi:hypothetical protein
MKILLCVLPFVIAGTVFAEDAQKPKQPLNLRLDESTSPAPRVTFGPSSATQTKEDREKALPELGGKPSTAFDRKLGSGTNTGISSGVIPSAMDPAVNRE